MVDTSLQEYDADLQREQANLQDARNSYSRTGSDSAEARVYASEERVRQLQSIRDQVASGQYIYGSLREAALTQAQQSSEAAYSVLAMSPAEREANRNRGVLIESQRTRPVALDNGQVYNVPLSVYSSNWLKNLRKNPFPEKILSQFALNADATQRYQRQINQRIGQTPEQLLNQLAVEQQNKQQSIKPTIEDNILNFNLKDYEKTVKELAKKNIPFLSEIAAREASSIPLAIIASNKKLSGPVETFTKRLASNTILLPKNILSLIKNPSNIKNIPQAIFDDFKDTVQLIKTSPTDAIAKIGADILTVKISGGILKLTGKVASNLVTKLSPKFAGVAKIGAELTVAGEKPILRLKKISISKVGNEIKFIRKAIPNEERLTSTTKALLKKFDKRIITKKEIIALEKKLKKETGSSNLNFKVVGSNLMKGKIGKSKIIKIKVVGRIPTESLSKQVKLAGKRVNAISSQAQSLVGLIRRRKIIRKPIPNEEKLPLSTRKLLKKFDKGKITAKELIKLDKQVRGAGVKKGFGGKAKGILERSFFADPHTRLRPSRLGIKGFEKEANIRELLSGKATFKRQKPQILLFEDVKIQKLPSSLKSVKRKLLSGKALNKLEAAKLLQYQQKITGRFKPIGFTTRESEITLAPGEIIKRVKKVGVTLVNGKRVPIISVKIVKQTKLTRKLLNKARIGNISSKELKTLSKRLSKETGFKYSSKLSSYKVGKKYYPFSRKAISSGISRISKTLSSRNKIISQPSKSRIKYTSRGQPYVITRSGARFISSGSRGKPSYKPPKYPSYSPPKSPPRYPPKSPPKSPPRYPPKSPPYYPPIVPPVKRRRIGNKIKRLSQRESKLGYRVWGKSGNKFIKLNKKPLSKQDALSRGKYAIDNTTSKTLKIVPIGKVKSFGSLLPVERGYGKRKKYKFRSYKVRKGKGYTLRNTYIEKRKYGIDTSGEKRQLSLARFAKQKGFIGKGSSIKNNKRTSPRIMKTKRRFKSWVGKSIPRRIIRKYPGLLNQHHGGILSSRKISKRNIKHTPIKRNRMVKRKKIVRRQRGVFG